MGRLDHLRDEPHWLYRAFNADDVIETESPLCNKLHRR